MTRLAIIFSTFLLLMGCGGDSTPPAADTAAAPEAPATEAVTEAAVDTPQVPALVEYIWQHKGPAFSDAGLQDGAAAWTALVQEAGYDMMGAYRAMPRFESENFDFLWVIMWPSQAARDTAWADWNANHAETWAAQRGEIYSYSKTFLFAPKPGRPPTVMNDSGQGISEYLFCSYNEGYGADDLAAHEQRHTAFMDAYEAENGAMTYWWATLSPQFDADNYDFMWFNAWQTDAEREAGWAAYSASPHAEEGTKAIDCSDPALFDSTRLL